MTIQVKQYLAKAIIYHIIGNKEQCEKHANKATELHSKEKHLHVSIGDILRAKGEIV